MMYSYWILCEGVIEQKSAFHIELRHSNETQVFEHGIMVLNSLKRAQGCVRQESLSGLWGKKWCVSALGSVLAFKV